MYYLVCSTVLNPTVFFSAGRMDAYGGMRLVAARVGAWTGGVCGLFCGEEDPQICLTPIELGPQGCCGSVFVFFKFIFYSVSLRQHLLLCTYCMYEVYCFSPGT